MTTPAHVIKTRLPNPPPPTETLLKTVRDATEELKAKDVVEIDVRGKHRDTARAMADEGARVLGALPANAWVVALDGRGKPWTSEQLATRLEHWRTQGRDLAFLIGGPEGHAPEVMARADECWSLGPLTLPHMLVRLVAGEQLYRAAALLANHPYHRA